VSVVLGGLGDVTMPLYQNATGAGIPAPAVLRPMNDTALLQYVAMIYNVVFAYALDGVSYRLDPRLDGSFRPSVMQLMNWSSVIFSSSDLGGVTVSLAIPGSLAQVSPAVDLAVVKSFVDYFVVMEYGMQSMWPKALTAAPDLSIGNFASSALQLQHAAGIPPEKIVATFGWESLDFECAATHVSGSGSTTPTR
jgi:hypothetical protein